MKYPNLTAGQGEAIINMIGGWEKFMAVLSGRARIVVEMIRYVVDLTADPYCPIGWRVIYHNPGPKEYEWNPTKGTLYLSPNQEGWNGIKGWDLFWELVNRGPLFNANMVNFWLANPDAFPSDWSVVYCWDTLYLHPFGGVYVRFAFRNGRKLDSDFRLVDLDFHSYDPAAAPAS